MIEPALRDEAFLADVRLGPRASDEFRLWWLGQSGFLVQWNRRHLLLDPYLSDSLTRKYAQTDKPHVRMTERVVAPDRLNFIDVVSSSHNHTDHLDGETLVPLFQVNPGLRLVCPEANQGFVQERVPASAGKLIALNIGGSAEAAGFRFTGIPAAHEEIEKDENGRARFLGYVVEFGPWTIYHSGDTIWHPEIVKSLSAWSIDVMLLPINGRNPARRVAGNLDGREAAQLAAKQRARVVIPCHYDMFEFNTASPEEFARAAAELGQPYRVLRNGGHFSSLELASSASARDGSMK